MENAAIEREEL